MTTIIALIALFFTFLSWVGIGPGEFGKAGPEIITVFVIMAPFVYVVALIVMLVQVVRGFRQGRHPWGRLVFILVNIVFWAFMIAGAAMGR